MKIGFFGMVVDKKISIYVESILHSLIENKIDITIEDKFCESLNEYSSFFYAIPTFSSVKELDDTSLLITFGGDGTLLRASTYVYNVSIPIIGINLGRLGFLANFNENIIDTIAEDLIHGNYKISPRTLIEVFDENDKPISKNNFALNELTVSRKVSSSLIGIDVNLNNEYLNTYWADGLIISTPTGSTGYSLSAGGPIIDPDCENFVITPIAPHNLFVRPYLVSDKSEFEIEVFSRENEYLLTLDSRVIELKKETKLKVRKSKRRVNIAQPISFSHLETLRTKLNWGRDIRRSF